jgi:hypothetical protein
MNNTKDRHNEILTTAKEVLEEYEIDITQPLGKNLLPLAKIVAQQTSCHIDTAKRNITKAIRQARGELAGQWGGDRRSRKTQSY